MSAAPLEVWGGLECSHVRIGDDYRDQIADTGHAVRFGDLERIAALGVRTLRYPVLWERVAPDGPDNPDWRWHDRRLAQLRRLDIRPIAGLIHHGSGPRWASVLDPHFVDAFAAYARQVARRYPWLELFTPVNEPLATARFSGLYGHWYPHGRDETVCFRFLVAECRAVAAAMKAIRAVTPGAKLVQTEDLGKVFATPELQYQADYENERRWLSLDLLTGRVTREHTFWRILVDHGVSEEHLSELAGEPCVPEIIGIDHYLTSDRFLDHRLDRHPHEKVGGNGRDAYVDTAAPWTDVPVAETGWLPRLVEVWQRYRLPIAMAEVHNGCTREEQLRWLHEAWHAAQEARRQGVDIRAMTAWAMFGAVDWNSLLIERSCHQEPGLFDCRFSPPRSTALAKAIASLVHTGRFENPALDRPGWWRRRRGEHGATPVRRLHLRGGGRLAEILAQRCVMRGLDFELGDSWAADKLRRARFWAVIEAEDNGSGGRSSIRCWHMHDASGSRERLPALLTVEARPDLDLVSVADACLDLVIDREEGRVRVSGREGGSLEMEFLQAGEAPTPLSRARARVPALLMAAASD